MSLMVTFILCAFYPSFKKGSRNTVEEEVRQDRNLGLFEEARNTVDTVN